MADARTEQLRELAEHRGFRLVRSRRRKPGGDFGRYGLVERESGRAILGVAKDGLTATGEDVEAFLRGKAAATWQSSLRQAGPPGKKPRKAARPKAPEADHAESPPPARKRARVGRPKPAPRARAKINPPAPKAPEPPKLAIRKAIARDAPELRALLGRLESSDPPEDIAGFIAAAARRGMPVLVADQGGLVGFVAGTVLQVLHRARPIGRISTLVVAPGNRRRGVGSALLDAAEAQLARRGCGIVEASADPDFPGAGAFFRARGYGRSTIRFDRSLE